MKVVHITASDGSGGADHSAVNLHRGLLDLGVKSMMLVGESVNRITGVHEVPKRRFGSRESLEELLIWSQRTPISNTYFSLNTPGTMLLDESIIQQADVINLHWVAGLISASSLLRLAKFGKPIVWTLHDTRPLTGGCHFPADCINYENICTNCPQLKCDYGGMVESGRSSLMQAVQSAQVHFVAPSSWMRHVASSSATARGNKISMIPYGVNQQLFFPGSQSEARRSLGLCSEATYILLASHSFEERRKGGPEAISILKFLAKEKAVSGQVANGKIRLLICGKKSSDFTIPGWVCEDVGYLPQDSMPLLYRAADLLLFTSIQDNLPNVVLEAMACGLAIVAHDLPGIRDLLGENHSAGIIVPVGEPKKSAEELGFLINNGNFKRELGCAARARIEKHFRLNQQATEYLKLYEGLCGAPKRENTSQSATRDDEYNALLSGLLERYKFDEKRILLNKRILDSASWKITGPLRKVQKTMNHLLGKKYEEYLH